MHRLAPLATLLVLALMTPVGHAQAPSVIPLPTCALDPETGLLIPADDAPDAIALWPTLHRGGVVAMDWFDARDRLQGMIQHCATGRTLRWEMRGDHDRAVRSELYQMLTSDQVYGFDDLRDAVRRRGGQARITASPGSCACDRPVWHARP
jgi:hypothetical protein